MEMNEPKYNFPIFSAIKKRYSIVTFANTQIIRMDPKGYIVSMFGFLQGDAPCCPSYHMEILYAKSNNDFKPITALTINRSYQSLPLSQDLNQYLKINKQTLTTPN